MSRWLGAALLAILIIVFLIANRGAYQGYFDADDLDNLSITSSVSLAHFARSLVILHTHETNSRTTGFLFYNVLQELAGMRFAWYVAALHLVHLLSAWVLFLLLRKLGLEPLPSAAGTLFWTFHAGMLEAYWRPMYCFDALLALFTLASMLMYVRRRFILSFVFFWLAFRSKEPGLMLPAVLLCYEFWLGERNWKRLTPFLLVSLVVGLQTVVSGVGADHGSYRVSVLPRDLWATATFYSSRILLVPYAGYALIGSALVWRDRRLYLGLSVCCLLILPMLAIPGRISGGYLCAALTGVAIMVAAVASRPGRFRIPLTVACLLLWAPWNHSHLRAARRTILADARERREFVSLLDPVVRKYPNTRRFICDAVPGQLGLLGVTGALSLSYREPVRAYWIEQEGLTKALGGEPAVLLHWDPAARILSAVGRNAGDLPQPYIEVNPLTPIWQLGEGWLGRDGPYRWTRPQAHASLWRPAGARRFELRSYAGSDLLGRSEVRLFVNGESAGSGLIATAGPQTLDWNLPLRPEGTAEIEFRVEPAFRAAPGDDLLGLPVMAFGFR